MKSFFTSLGQPNKTKIILFIIGALIILLIVFKIGVFVGYKKAQFSYRWGENYNQNFAGPRRGFFGNFNNGFGDRDFINGHGTMGSIIKIDTGALVILGGDNFEKTILLSSSTKIIGRNNLLKISDLKVDGRIVVIGSPNDQGQINAKLIRVFD